MVQTKLHLAISKAPQNSNATMISLQARVVPTKSKGKWLRVLCHTLSFFFRRDTLRILTLDVSSSLMKKSSSHASGASQRSSSSTERSQMLLTALRQEAHNPPASRILAYSCYRSLTASPSPSHSCSARRR